MQAIRGLGPIQAPRRTTKRSVQGFTMPEEATQEALSTAPSTPAASLAPLLEADDVVLCDDPVRRDRAAREHGAATLDALATLHLALLGGADSAESLARLEQLATLPTAADPRLDAVLRAIATRAAVELARRRVPIASAC